jgi:hypothetical protein
MSTIVVIAAISILLLLVILFRLGRFPGTTELNAIKNALWRRYLHGNFDPGRNEDRQNADRLITYAERVVDRQINKARGILPFNSIIIAVFSFERTKFPSPEFPTGQINLTVLLYFAIALLAASSILCLMLFLVHWGRSYDYRTFATEFANTLDRVRSRSKVIEWATMMSIAAVILGAVLIATVELGSWNAPLFGFPPIAPF